MSKLVQKLGDVRVSAATSVNRKMTLSPQTPLFEMAKPFYFITLLFLPPHPKQSSCIILLRWSAVKCISPWSFLKGLISKLRYNHQALQDWNKARNPQEPLPRIWQSLKRRQFGNNYLQLNCWTWMVLSAMSQTGFLTARRSTFQHFSLFDNDCQRSSMTSENEPWGVYGLWWLPSGSVMRNADVK